MSDSFIVSTGLWDDAGNWSAGIPAAGTSVTISATTSFLAVSGVSDVASAITADGLTSGGADNTFDITGYLSVSGLSDFSSFNVDVATGSTFISAQLELDDSTMEIYGIDTISNGGGLTMNSSTLIIESGASLNLAQIVHTGAGELLVLGTVEATGGGPGEGTGTIGSGGLVIVDGSEGAGTIWELTGGATFSSGQSFQRGTFEFSGTGNLLDLPGDSVNNGSGITVTGFDYGDTAILGVASNADAVTASLSGGVLTLTQDDSTVQQISDFAIAADAVASDLKANVVNGEYVVTLCFYPGTRLAAEHGEIEVQDITEGTMLRTVTGALLPVRWLGWTDISLRFADKQRALPIRIKAGALADGVPSRDLLVSPDHAVFAGGVLAQAGALVNGTSIIRETGVPENFRYYHVELATHELLLAENCPAESFVDNVDRINFHNWGDRATPATAVTEMDLPRVKAARQLPAALRHTLSIRAGQAAA